MSQLGVEGRCTGSQSSVSRDQVDPLNKLVQSPRNVRRHSDPAADAELKASIAARAAAKT